MFEVEVLLFSVLKERVGAGEVRVVLPPTASGDDLLDRLVAHFPALAPYRPTIRIAVNMEYVSPDSPIREGDEVALITPVSGG